MHERRVMQSIRTKVSDPTAIGLFGLAIVTLVASSQKLGLTSGTSLIVPWAIFLGALAQLYASFSDSKLGNSFGATAFGAYGFFWLAVAMSWMIQTGMFGEAMKAAADGNQLGIAFVGYLIFTLYMTYGAASVHKVLFFIFVLIDLLFIGLALNTLAGSEFGRYLAGFSELGISLLAFYGSAAAIYRAHFGKTVLPVGKPILNREKRSE